MVNPLFILAGGLIALIISAEAIIKSAQIIAQKLNITETFIGLTLLSIGTSLPEISSHVIASYKVLQGDTQVSSIVLGTNIGSNAFQITVIMGLVALFAFVHANKSIIKRDYMVMLGSIVVIFLLSLNGFIGRLEGFLLIGLYLIYLWNLGKIEHFAQKVGDGYSQKHLIGAILLIPIAFAGLFFSAYIVLGVAEQLVTLWGVSGSLVGVLVIGLGTALPELATAVSAIRAKSSGMSLGVLVGSNITNPLFGIGLGAIISGYTVSNNILWVDLPGWFLLSILPVIFLGNNMKLDTWEGVVLIGSWVAFAAFRLFVIG